MYSGCEDTFFMLSSHRNKNWKSPERIPVRARVVHGRPLRVHRSALIDDTARSQPSAIQIQHSAVFDEDSAQIQGLPLHSFQGHFHLSGQDQ